MKKRVLAGLMMTVMVLASAMSVSAAPSKQEPVVEYGASEGKYDITTGTNEFAKKDTEEEAKHTAAIKIVTDINEGKTVSISTEVDNAIKGKKLVQKFFDLDAINDHAECVNKGYHTVTLKVDAMTTGWKNITVVHYSQDRQVWETIKVEDKNVDYTNKTITFNIKDLSPVAIYADVVSDGATGTSPSTEGVSSAWMLYTAMALIVLGAGVVVYQKKRG